MNDNNTVDAALQDDVMRRAAAAHRRAESALGLMFGNFGRYEDSSRASRLLEVALEREQQAWIAAFGSPPLKELAAQAEARDEAGRLVSPWLRAAGAVEARVMTEWQRAPAWIGARTPGQEWAPIVHQTHARAPNAFRAFVQRQHLARATVAADAAWARKWRADVSLPVSKTTWQTRWKQRFDGDLHEKLKAALDREWKAWVAVHGSPALKRLPSFHDRWGSSCAHRPEDALRGMRQLGVEWLAKHYPGWQFVDGYRMDGHRSTLGGDHNFCRVDPSHQRALESVLGTALGALVADAKRIDPAAELVVFTEAGQARDRGSYVFGATVVRRLPGSWVKEPLRLVFGPQKQRELNAMAAREMGVTPTRGKLATARAQTAAEPTQQIEASIRSPILSTKEATMRSLQDVQTEQLEGLARQYNKPVLPVPQGASVEGRVVAVLMGDQPGRGRAVVENDRAIHVIGIGIDAARQVLGDRVVVDNVRGKLSMSTSEDRARLPRPLARAEVRGNTEQDRAR